MRFSLCTLLLVCVSLLFGTADAAPAEHPSAQPSPDFLIGTIRYFAARGYLVGYRSDHLLDDDIPAYIAPVPTAQELGDTIEYVVKVPDLKLEFRVRKTDYVIPENGVRIKNTDFRSTLRHESTASVNADRSWTRISLKVHEKPATIPPRYLSLSRKSAILSNLLRRPVPVSEIPGRYLFSSLTVFENRLWIWDSQDEILYDVISAGDLDDVDYLAKQRLTEVWTRKLSEIDFTAGILVRSSSLEHVDVTFGFLACFKDNAR